MVFLERFSSILFVSVVSEPIYQPYQGREWETESSSEWYPQPFYTAQVGIFGGSEATLRF